MKNLKLALLFMVVLLVFPACKDSDDDLFWIPATSSSEEATNDNNDEGNNDDEGKTEPQGYGILLAAPYSDNYTDVVQWTEAINAVVDCPVTLGFTSVPDWDDKKYGKEDVPPDVPTLTSAALKLNSYNLAAVVVFRVVVCPDGAESAAMDDELDVELGNLSMPYSLVNGFGYGDFMVASVFARVAKICKFDKESSADLPYVKPSQSALIVTMLECADSVPQSSIDAMKGVFKHVEIYDMDNLFWVVLVVNILDGGNNVIVPYFTTLSESALTKHALMTMGGILGIMQEGTILSDESSIEYLMTLL